VTTYQQANQSQTPSAAGRDESYSQSRKPFKELTKGSTVLKVYKDIKGVHTLAYYMNGQRKRERITHWDDVKARADELFTAIANGETATLDISQERRASLLRAEQLITKTGKSIELVAAEHAELIEMLGNVAPKEAAAYYLKHHQERPEIDVKALVTEMLDKKRAEGQSKRWIDDLDSRLGKFSKHFQCAISMVTGQDVDRWLQTLADEDGKGLGIRSKKNYRTAAATLFRFAKDRGYLPADWSGMAGVGFSKAPDGKVQVWSPEELSQILNAAAARPNEPEIKLVPWIALRAFAGIRFEEMPRLMGTALQFKANLIVVEAEVGKTQTRRLIPMQRNLKAWLKPYKFANGLIVSRGSIENVYAEVLADIGFAPRHNALRDSYASYRLAQTGYDKFKVAEECGNSPRKLEKNYRALRTNDGQLITKQLAATYFSITPKKVTNVIQLRKTG
jgi:site-specific recombinase XerD